jgi:hypothetical protein
MARETTLPLVLCAALLAACSPAGGRKSTVSSLGLTPSDFEPARGATALTASPQGGYLACELIFSGETAPAIIKVIERASGKVVAHARGDLLGAPDDRGEALYVDRADLAHPRLRSTARPELAAPLAAATADFARWSGHRLAATPQRLVMLREEPGGVTLAVLQLPEGTEVATRTLPSGELSLLAAAISPLEDTLYLSGKTPGGPASGAVVAIDGNTLRERWRAPWPDGHLFSPPSPLAVTGDGARVAVFARSGLFVVDAHSGAGGQVVRFDGLDASALVGVPGRAALVALRTFASPIESPAYNVEVIELPSGKVEELVPQRGSMPPAAVAVVGSSVLLAPGAPPRYFQDPSSWGPEASGFVSP